MLCCHLSPPAELCLLRKGSLCYVDVAWSLASETCNQDTQGASELAVVLHLQRRLILYARGMTGLNSCMSS